MHYCTYTYTSIFVARFLFGGMGGTVVVGWSRTYSGSWTVPDERVSFSYRIFDLAYTRGEMLKHFYDPPKSLFYEFIGVHS